VRVRDGREGPRHVYSGQHPIRQRIRRGCHMGPRSPPRQTADVAANGSNVNPTPTSTPPPPYYYCDQLSDNVIGCKLVFYYCVNATFDFHY
jgi:hypothetical protein